MEGDQASLLATQKLGPVLHIPVFVPILWRHGIAPAPKRSQTTAWKDFRASRLAVLAGMDFFTAQVITWRSLTTFYFLFAIHLETRRVTLAGITPHPNEQCMEQTVRNLTEADSGALVHQSYLLHDRVRSSARIPIQFARRRRGMGDPTQLKYEYR